MCQVERKRLQCAPVAEAAPVIQRVLIVESLSDGGPQELAWFNLYGASRPRFVAVGNIGLSCTLCGHICIVAELYSVSFPTIALGPAIAAFVIGQFRPYPGLHKGVHNVVREHV